MNLNKGTHLLKLISTIEGLEFQVAILVHVFNLDINFHVSKVYT
jgi:hypothetical protein